MWKGAESRVPHWQFFKHLLTKIHCSDSLLKISQTLWPPVQNLTKKTSRSLHPISTSVLLWIGPSFCFSLYCSFVSLSLSVCLSVRPFRFSVCLSVCLSSSQWMKSEKVLIKADKDWVDWFRQELSKMFLNYFRFQSLGRINPKNFWLSELSEKFSIASSSIFFFQILSITFVMTEKYILKIWRIFRRRHRNKNEVLYLNQSSVLVTWTFPTLKNTSAALPYQSIITLTKKNNNNKAKSFTITTTTIAD